MAQGNGIRQNEIIQLTWDAVDLERGVFGLRQKIRRRGHPVSSNFYLKW